MHAAFTPAAGHAGGAAADAMADGAKHMFGTDDEPDEPDEPDEQDEGPIRDEKLSGASSEGALALAAAPSLLVVLSAVSSSWHCARCK